MKNERIVSYQHGFIRSHLTRFFWIKEKEVEKVEDVDIEMLNELLKLLSKSEQNMIFLYLAGKSHSDIAEEIGISITNVGTKIHRIMLNLKYLSNIKYF